MDKMDVLNWLEDNEDEFNDAIEELDSWNGYLGDDRWYEMSEFDELMCHLSPSDIVASLDDSFNINDWYFRYGVYGVESADYKDYSDYLGEGFVDDLVENKDHLCLDKELEEMLDKLADDDEERVA
jgi:hypothetical protein